MDPSEIRPIPPVLDWPAIQTVLLDMDGVLLDRRFDDLFFQQTAVAAFATKNRLDFETARQRVFDLYQSVEGTLHWYDLDHWSRVLELDIPALQRDAAHLIRVHPHVLDFLDQVRASGRPRFLVTNAHPHSLDLKRARTPIADYLTAVVSSHELGHPKEDPLFWPLLRDRLGFDPASALLVDDGEAILDAAAAFGVGHLLHMARPSSALTPEFSARFPSATGFHQVMPD